MSYVVPKSPVKTIRVTQSELRAMPEYSCSTPSLGAKDTMWLKPWGRFPVKLFKRSKMAAEHNGAAGYNETLTEWWIGWHEIDPTDPGYILTRFSDIEIIAEKVA